MHRSMTALQQYTPYLLLTGGFIQVSPCDLSARTNGTNVHARDDWFFIPVPKAPLVIVAVMRGSKRNFTQISYSDSYCTVDYLNPSVVF